MPSEVCFATPDYTALSGPQCPNHGLHDLSERPMVVQSQVRLNRQELLWRCVRYRRGPASNQHPVHKSVARRAEVPHPRKSALSPETKQDPVGFPCTGTKALLVHLITGNVIH